MENTIFQYDIHPDELGRRLYQYRIKAFHAGYLKAAAEENPQSYIHLFRIDYIVRGRGLILADQQVYPVEAGSAVFLPPSALLIPTEEQEELEVYFVNFEISNLPMRQEFLRRMSSLIPQFQVRDTEDQAMKFMLENIFAEASNHQPGGCLIIQNLFSSLLIFMVRQAQKGLAPHSLAPIPVKNTNYLISRAVSYIQLHLQENLSVKGLAQHLGISEIYLYKLFKAHTGQSVQLFILNYRLQIAKDYLSNPDYTVKMIADELGFASPHHFSSIFRKHVGVSPTGYRRQLQEQNEMLLNPE